jgi:hypothetical protein
VSLACGGADCIDDPLALWEATQAFGGEVEAAARGAVFALRPAGLHVLAVDADGGRAGEDGGVASRFVGDLDAVDAGGYADFVECFAEHEFRGVVIRAVVEPEQVNVDGSSFGRLHVIRVSRGGVGRVEYE